MLETFGVYVRNILQSRLKVFLTAVTHSCGEVLLNMYSETDNIVGINI